MGAVIVVIFGLMGTGKTTLAQALSRLLGWPAVMSDAVRKHLAGLAPTTPTPTEFGKGIYDEDHSRHAYAEMRRLAWENLKTAAGVILDGSYKRAGERELVREMGRELKARVLFVYCACPEDVVRERLKIRRMDPQAISDGREEILAAQAADFDPIEAGDRPLLWLDTSREPDAVLQEAKNFIAKFES